MTDSDPLLDTDGNLRDVWRCPDCRTNIHLHEDPAHPSQDVTRDVIREHEYVHRERCEAEHNGDRGMLRLALRYPHLHAAIIQVHGPATDLHPDHRAHILRTAGIKDPHEGSSDAH